MIENACRAPAGFEMVCDGDYVMLLFEGGPLKPSSNSRSRISNQPWEIPFQLGRKCRLRSKHRIGRYSGDATTQTSIESKERANGLGGPEHARQGEAAGILP